MYEAQSKLLHVFFLHRDKHFKQCWLIFNSNLCEIRIQEDKYSLNKMLMKISSNCLRVQVNGLAILRDFMMKCSIEHKNDHRYPTHSWCGHDIQARSALPALNTLRPRRNEQHFADDIFKRIFFNENVWISITISLKFVPKGLINNIPALAQIMAWRRPGEKPLSETMMVRLLTHKCVTRPQWVNEGIHPGLLCFLYCWSDHIFGQIVELPVVWDVMKLMWCHHNVS